MSSEQHVVTCKHYDIINTNYTKIHTRFLMILFGAMSLANMGIAGFTRQICDLVVGRQLTAVDARHKLTRCLHDRHGQGQATSSDIDNRSLPLACLPLLAGTDRRHQTASKMAPERGEVCDQ